ncbi:dienelactone hydrolase family protein [Microbacterium sp. zg.Y1090]|uniref:alpha/beta hydrolase family protein n=1 Tax=Microbacterium wangruii TaxID=3049073 RepID=UPI00214CF896|nr:MULTISPECIES: alpha/beta family hydrolase [unclassified Microbacterium]MCR2818491.1 dienelactone hydrolase family protein [Microbacterium sp. zg.Y1090]MDL5486304.1 dienelactone hydrolase family protein [Microbacterium sp. zg-Y1211]WIM29500.1 dienelactone hydrolase family protein [Microbacterium sp. zg-Y1090]
MPSPVVSLPSGDTVVSADAESPPSPWAAMAVAHGAGAGYRHPFLVGFTRGMVAAGVATLRFNFPYVEAGRRMPGPPAAAVVTWQAAEATLRELHPDLPLWAVGKSYGGRMASLAAADGMIAPTGLVYLGYPLHPPGRPDKPRVDHLPRVTPPQLFVEGTNDPFVDPHEQLQQAVATCRDASVHWIEGGNHSFEVKGRRRPADEIGEQLAADVAGWMRTHA